MNDDAGAATAAPVSFSAPAGTLSARIVASGEEWDRAAAAWAALKSRGAAVGLFQDHGWLSAWWRAIAADPANAARVALHTVVLSDAAGPALIAPLVLRREKWPGRLAWMAADVSDYCDVIAAPGVDCDAAWTALRAAMAGSGAAYAHLHQIRPDGAAARLFGARLEVEAKAVLSPFISLEGRSWEEIEKGLSSNLRQDVRRKAKRLAKRAPWAYVEYQDAERRRAAVDFVLAQKRRQFADKPDELAGIDGVFAPFAAEVFAKNEIGEAQVHVSALESNGRILAAHLGFVDAERFYYYVPAYDPEFHADSPGQLLIVELIRRAAEARVPVFDMLRGDYAYKWRLTDRAVDLQSMTEALSLAGWGYLRARALAKRLRRG